ncbi:MAG: glycoside hydrolase family 43 protein [Propionibacteriaceae bacterium]|jgi:alpha-N-arabinofuranosidase|nr:glycoside hydrolase family 43 protein [Propionibacteriaceae bacterium]
MTRVSNPILPGCHPDPSVCRVGDDYYLVTSTFEYFPGLPVCHSRDLVHWERIGAVIDRAGQLPLDGLSSSSGLYAPTIRYHDELFWVVCTVVDLETEGPSYNFVVSAADPAGPWSQPTELAVDGCDPSLLFDDDGRAWAHGMRLPAEPLWPEQTEIWLREFDTGSRALVGPERIIWRGALAGATWAEGPHLYKIDGYYYLLAAEAGTHFFHAEAVARADTVTGPYIGYEGNPVLTHRHLGRHCDVTGVGHADLVQGPDGSWWALHLGMRPYGGYHYNLGRETFLTPVTWEEGWPVFAPGVGRTPPQVEVPFLVGEPPSHARAGAVLPGDPRWTSLRGPADAFATPHGDGWLLRPSAATLEDQTTPAFLGVRQEHVDADVTARLRPSLEPDEEAGLAVRQSERSHLRWSVRRLADGALSASAVQVVGGEAQVLGTVPAAGDSEGRVELGLSIRGQEYRLLAGPAGPGQSVVAVADGRFLDSVSAGGFLGVWIGVYATANGRPSSSSVVVESFTYDSR